MPSFTYTPIVAKAHTPPYKIHKYFARRPHNVFNQLIENFTSPGEIILDPFCGGGVTIYEGVTQDRRVIGCDLNPLSTFIVRNMIKKSEDIEVLEKCFRELRCYLETLVKDYYFPHADCFPLHSAHKPHTDFAPNTSPRDRSLYGYAPVWRLPVTPVPP